MIVHLGDSGPELNKIKSQFPQIPLKAVRGNCDMWSNLPERDSFNLGGVGIFMTHGHLYNVKSGLSSLLNAGHFSEAGLVLYGHTHVSHYERLGEMEILNPGSCGRGLSRSFAIVHIGTDGGIACRIVAL